MGIPDFLEPLLEVVGDIVRRYGTWGIATAMFLESAGVPFASSVVIFTSGSMIYSGKVPFWKILLSSTAGITAGSVLSYGLGFVSSEVGGLCKRLFSRRQSTDPENNPRQSRICLFWQKYGNFSIFMGQLFGPTRTFISFPAGAMHMNLPLFIAYTALGGAIFSLLAIGFSLILTRTLGLVLYYLGLLLALPPWTWLLTAAVLTIIIIVYRRLGWHFSPQAICCRFRRRFMRKKE